MRRMVYDFHLLLVHTSEFSIFVTWQLQTLWMEWINQQCFSVNPHNTYVPSTNVTHLKITWTTHAKCKVFFRNSLRRMKTLSMHYITSPHFHMLLIETVFTFALGWMWHDNSHNFHKTCVVLDPFTSRSILFAFSCSLFLVRNSIIKILCILHMYFFF